MWSLFGGGKREVKFRVSLSVQQLRGIPFRHGQLFVKMKHGRRSEMTKHVAIDTSNNATWNAHYTFEAKLVVAAKTNVLDSHFVYLTVKHQLPRRNKIRRVGKVQVDLAEFASSRETSRLYLLQDADINSVLLVTVGMEQTAGDPMFKCRDADGEMYVTAGGDGDDGARAIRSTTSNDDSGSGSVGGSLFTPSHASGAGVSHGQGYGRGSTGGASGAGAGAGAGSGGGVGERGSVGGGLRVGASAFDSSTGVPAPVFTSRPEPATVASSPRAGGAGVGSGVERHLSPTGGLGTGHVSPHVHIGSGDFLSGTHSPHIGGDFLAGAHSGPRMLVDDHDFAGMHHRRVHSAEYLPPAHHHHHHASASDVVDSLIRSARETTHPSHGSLAQGRSFG